MDEGDAGPECGDGVAGVDVNLNAALAAVVTESALVAVRQV